MNEQDQKREADLHTPEVIARLNAPRAWEELNPDWVEDGDLTDRFAKSQFDGCPGCGEFEQIGVYVATEDLDVAVSCHTCGWQVFGDCPSAAIDKWNTRAGAAANAELLAEVLWSIVCPTHLLYAIAPREDGGIKTDWSEMDEICAQCDLTKRVVAALGGE